MPVGVSYPGPNLDLVRRQLLGEAAFGQEQFSFTNSGVNVGRDPTIGEAVGLISQTGVDIGELSDEVFAYLASPTTNGFSGQVLPRANLTPEQREQYNERFREMFVREQRGTEGVRVFDALTDTFGAVTSLNLLDEGLGQLRARRKQAGENPDRTFAPPDRGSLFNVLSRSNA